MGAIRPVSRREPCPNGLNCPPAFNLTRGNSNTRHAGGYSSRRPRAAGALVRLALRPPCLPPRTPPALRRAACRVGVVRWCARFARFPPVWRVFVVRLVLRTSAPAFAALWGVFSCLVSFGLYQPRRASCGGLVGRCLAPSQHQRGGCLACLVRVCRACSYQHTNGGGRINIRRRGDVARHNNAAAVLASVVRCRGILAPFPLLVLVLVR